VSRILKVFVSVVVAASCLVHTSIAATAQESALIRAADTSSPRDTLKSFIDSCNELNDFLKHEKVFDRTLAKHRELATRVLDCIDASELPAFAREEAAGEVAVCIKEILDRVELPAWDTIPDTTEIEAAGGLEMLSRWRIPGTRITIARVEEGPQKHEYLFSTGTVDRAVDYYHSIRTSPYRTEGPAVSEGFFDWYMSSPGHPVMAAIVQRLPERMRYSRTLGLATWKWPGLIIAMLVVIFLMATAYYGQRILAGRVQDDHILKYCLTIVFPLGAMLIPLGFKYFAERFLTVRGTPLYIVSFSANVVMLLASVVVIFSANRRVAESIIASPRINPRGLNAQLIRICSQLMSVFVTVIVFLVGGQYLGIPLATLLASAGVGGIAVALGAQDTLKTLFGTVALMADKPFRVGERILFEKYDGVVEDIGLRSTKLRLLTGHQVTLPNDQLARSDIENIGRRIYIRRKGEIHIPLDTACHKVEQAVQIVKDKLENHEGMDADYPPRVFFDDFKPGAFCIRFFYWYTPPEYWDFKAFSEKLNFEIFHAFEEQKIPFSLPARHSYWKHDQEQGPFDVNVVGDSAPTDGGNST